MPRRSFRPGAREEFAACLSDTTLDSNDVQGMRKVCILSSSSTAFSYGSLPLTSLTALDVSLAC